MVGGGWGVGVRAGGPVLACVYSERSQCQRNTKTSPNTTNNREAGVRLARKSKLEGRLHLGCELVGWNRPNRNDCAFTAKYLSTIQ